MRTELLCTQPYPCFISCKVDDRDDDDRLYPFHCLYMHERCPESATETLWSSGDFAPFHGSIFLAAGPCVFHARSTSLLVPPCLLFHSIVIRNRLPANFRRGDRPAGYPQYCTSNGYTCISILLWLPSV